MGWPSSALIAGTDTEDPESYAWEINPDNARILRITAAAGTELADPYSYGTCRNTHVDPFIPV